MTLKSFIFCNRRTEQILSFLNLLKSKDPVRVARECGSRARWALGSRVTWLWGSGGVGRLPPGCARAVRGPEAHGRARPTPHPLRRARWYDPAHHRERHAADDSRRRSQSPARCPPLPAPPSAPPRWAAAAPSLLLSTLSLSLSMCLWPGKTLVFLESIDGTFFSKYILKADRKVDQVHKQRQSVCFFSALANFCYQRHAADFVMVQ